MSQLAGQGLERVHACSRTRQHATSLRKMNFTSPEPIVGGSGEWHCCNVRQTSQNRCILLRGPFFLRVATGGALATRYPARSTFLARNLTLHFGGLGGAAFATGELIGFGEEVRDLVLARVAAALDVAACDSKRHRLVARECERNREAEVAKTPLAAGLWRNALAGLDLVNEELVAACILGEHVVLLVGLKAAAHGSLLNTERIGIRVRDVLRHVATAA